MKVAVQLMSMWGGSSRQATIDMTRPTHITVTHYAVQASWYGVIST